MYLKKVKNSEFFQIVYYKNGNKTTYSTGMKKRKEAEKILCSFNPVLEIQKEELKPINKNINLHQFLNEYISYIKSSKSKDYLRSVKLSFNHLEKFIGNPQLNSITVRLTESFVIHTFQRSKYSALLYFRTLKAAFSKAVVWEYMDSNPFKKIRPPKIPKKNPVFINKDQLDIIMAHTKEKYIKNIFMTAFYTGMRLGELVNMEWDWIDLSNQIITVKNSEHFTTKSKKERIIPIAKQIQYIFINNYPKANQLKNNGYVFIRVKGIKLNQDYITKKFKKAIRAAKLNDEIHFHTLRHSFASNLVQKNVSLYVVKELMGHESISTTQIYSHLKKENLIEAVNLI